MLSSVIRRLFLEALDHTFKAGEPTFRGALTDLNHVGRFAGLLREARGINWVVYAKPPFDGPEHVLDYLRRSTLRVAIANSRLTRIEDGNVSF